MQGLPGLRRVWDIVSMLRQVAQDDSLRRIEFLDGRGHLSLTWDPSIVESVQRAHADFVDLQRQGYQFFRVFPREPASGFVPEAGVLEVVRVDASEVEPRSEDSQPQPNVTTKLRRGRIRKERIVAARPMAGG